MCRAWPRTTSPPFQRPCSAAEAGSFLFALRVLVGALFFQRLARLLAVRLFRRLVAHQTLLVDSSSLPRACGQRGRHLLDGWPKDTSGTRQVPGHCGHGRRLSTANPHGYPSSSTQGFSSTLAVMRTSVGSAEVEPDAS